jgi:hypothetical protein
LQLSSLCIKPSLQPFHNPNQTKTCKLQNANPAAAIQHAPVRRLDGWRAGSTRRRGNMYLVGRAFQRRTKLETESGFQSGLRSRRRTLEVKYICSNSFCLASVGHKFAARRQPLLSATKCRRCSRVFLLLGQKKETRDILSFRCVIGSDKK